MAALYKKYYPIECDLSLSHDEKSKYFCKKFFNIINLKYLEEWNT